MTGISKFTRGWQVELAFAAPIIALVICLFYTWFAVHNRYLIFLYYHDMGPGFDTSPFGAVTAGRYWMAGLVAAGAVMLPYSAVNLALGRLKSFRPPQWRRVWALCAVPLLISIPAIVMTVNDPVLPLRNAAQVTAATLIGLALAVMLGQVAAERPLAYLLLMGDGFALACLLIPLASIESVPRWLARGSTGVIYISMYVGMLAAGLVLLGVVSVFYGWRGATQSVPGAADLFVAGLNVTYLFFPFFHLFWCSDQGSWTDPGYSVYISSSDNYFARTGLIQIGIWIAVALLAVGLTRLRLRLSRRLALRSEAL